MLAAFARISLLAVATVVAGCGDSQPGARTGLPRPAGASQLAVVATADGRTTIGLTTVDGAFSAWPLNGELHQVGQPAWFPDGTRLAFTGVIAERHGDRFVYPASDVFTFDGDGVQRLTTGEDASMPAVSPDGDQIAFVRMAHPGQRPFSTTLWLMRSDGSDQHRVFEDVDNRVDQAPTWSPDGTRIAFTRCQVPDHYSLSLSPCEIWTSAVDGSGATRLAEHGTDPAWSPDGSAIAYASDVDRNGIVRTGEDESAYAAELYLMRPDGSHQTRVSTSEVAESAPSFSPDGSWIAYDRTGPEDFSTSVFRVRADGTCPTLILSASPRRSVSSPAWRPAGGSIDCPSR
jgi:Tol biopolymer transport system component